MLSDAGIQKDSEELEAYKYAFRDFATWTATMNYYRSAASRKSANFWSQNQTKIRNISVRTLEIFGTADKYLTVEGARNSSKYVQNHSLELLEGISHWVQQEAAEKVNSL